MLLYLMRHAETEHDPPKPTMRTIEELHLTSDGKAWTGRLVSLVEKELGFHPERILASPLARAKETAEIARHTLNLKPEVEYEQSLKADGEIRAVYAAVRKQRVESVAIVSHIPIINRLFADLLGADANIGLYTGAIACIRIKGNPGRGKGMLLWMVPPRMWFDGKQWA